MMINKKALLVGVGICMGLSVIVPLAISFYYFNGPIYATGTITYVDLEGGFFGIIGDNHEGYDPINMPDAFKIDGLRVVFSALKREDMVSYHMWGTIIELIEIHILKI